GMAAGSSVMSASYLPAYLAFSILTVVPVCVRMFATPDHVHRVMGIQLTLFVLATAGMARASGRFSREASQLRSRLMLASQHLAELNETLESRVVERTAALELALAARDEFILVASHELKTPLTTLKTQLQLIDRDLHKVGMRVRVRLSPRFAL